MSSRIWPRILAPFVLLIALAALSASCLGGPTTATATPTKTPRRAAQAAAVASPTAAMPDLPTATPVPTVAPTATSSPTAVPPTATASPTASPVPPTAAPTAVPATRPPVATQPPAPTAPPPPPTQPPAPSADFTISELRALGLNENNGGIESGGQHIIFITVLDAAGNPLNGAKIVNAAAYPGEATSGDKGAGKAEIVMWKEVFQLKVASLNGQPVTSEVSHNMSLISPVAADVAGKLGNACPSVDNCPFPLNKHFSYAITFRQTR